MLQETLREVVLRPSSFTLGGSGRDSGEWGRGVRSHVVAGGKCTQTQSHPEPWLLRSQAEILNFGLQGTEPQALDPTSWHMWGAL